MRTPTASHQFLHAGCRYRVIRGFRDFDGEEHAVGERWTFLGSSFVPYEDGLSLYVTLDDGTGDMHDRQIRMQWRPEAQGPVLDHLAAYIAPD